MKALIGIRIFEVLPLDDYPLLSEISGLYIRNWDLVHSLGRFISGRSLFQYHGYD
jgi:hypothetical protein